MIRSLSVAATILAMVTGPHCLFAQEAIYVAPNGAVGIGRQPDTTYSLDVQGDIRSGGNIRSEKDINTKTNIAAVVANVTTVNATNIKSKIVAADSIRATKDISVAGSVRADQNIRLKGTHIVYDSRFGVINFGEDHEGALIIRSLQTKGDESVYNDRFIISKHGLAGNLTMLDHVIAKQGINITNGVIQKSGDRIITTNDLGLYSTVKGDGVRLVSNQGRIMFFTKGGNVAKGNDDNISMVIDNDFIGIGPTTPEMPLMVTRTKAGGNGRYNQSRSRIITWTGVESPGDERHFGNCSIYANGDIVSGNVVASVETRNYSDIRIKKDITPTSSREDLETLRSVEIVNYKMIDTVVNNASFKKVIAQQVQKVYPQAVAPYSYYLPSVFQQAQAVSKITDSLYSIAVASAHKLTPGDRIKLKCYPGVEEIFASVKEITSPTQFTASLATPVTDGTSVFVYGKAVNDLLTVDYDALSMLNISATQELAKTIDDQQKRIAQLERAQIAYSNSNQQLQKENTDMKFMLTELESRIKLVEEKTSNDARPKMALLK